MSSITYAQIVKSNADNTEDKGVYNMHTEQPALEKKRRRRRNSKKTAISESSSITQDSYESDLYKEHPYFPLSPIKEIQDKQKELLNKKACIVPIKIIKRPELTPTDPVQPSFSPSDKSQFAIKTPIIMPAGFTYEKPSESIQRIFTCMPTAEQFNETMEEQQVQQQQQSSLEKNAKVLSSAYESTIKLQQKEIMANSEVIENQKQTIKEQSKGINTNNTRIASQIKTLEEHTEEISTKKDEIIKLSHQLSTIQSSYEHYNAELSKVYGNWMHYYKLLSEIQQQYVVEYQKNQQLIQQNAILEQQLIAQGQQLQLQQQQQQQQQVYVPQYYHQVHLPQEQYQEQYQEQEQPQIQPQEQQYVTFPMPSPEFMNAFMQAMAAAANTSTNN
jgi:hypothetical protein